MAQGTILAVSGWGSGSFNTDQFRLFMVISSDTTWTFFFRENEPYSLVFLLQKGLWVSAQESLS